MIRSAVMGVLIATICGCAQPKQPSEQPSASYNPQSQRDQTNSPLRDQPILMGATQFKYTVGDETGNALAYGVLIMPWPVAEGQSFRGTWQARPVLLPVTDKPADPPKIGPQLGGGQLVGQREGDRLRVSLNPNMNDNNVTLIGQISGDELHGTWEWATFSGVSAHGKFAASRSD